MKKLILTILLLTFTFHAFTQEIDIENPNAEEAFFIEYIQKQIESQNNLTLMHKAKMLEKLGKESVPGKISGKLSYKTQISGLSGIVTISYDNYCDTEGWIFNGKLITKANIKGNGSFDGEIEVNGKYKAKVKYSQVILKDSKAAGGNYIIELENQEAKEVSYKWYKVAEDKMQL